MMDMGYAGVQMGTRFIATTECTAHADYKQAIVEADARRHRADRAAHGRAGGRDPQRLHRDRHQRRPDRPLDAPARKTKYWMRTLYALSSLRRLKKSALVGGCQEYWQAGKSVGGIHEVESAREVIEEFAAAL